jgi:hypothetical protein
VLGAVGAAAIAGTAVSLAIVSRSRPAPAIVAAPSAEESATPSAPLSSSPSSSPAPPRVEATEEGILVVEANAPILAVRVEGRETTVARPAKRVSLPIEDSQRGRDLAITVIAVDGRKADAKGNAGAKAISVTFTGAPPKIAKPTPKTHPPAAPAATTTATGLAESPYKN